MAGVYICVESDLPAEGPPVSNNHSFLLCENKKPYFIQLNKALHSLRRSKHYRLNPPISEFQESLFQVFTMIVITTGICLAVVQGLKST